MLLGLETFSYYLAFSYGKMNIFDFIKRTAELGLDGVQINVEGPDLGHLGSEDSGFLQDLRAVIGELGMFVELDTCDTNPRNLTRVLNICNALGAERMRVYASIGGDVQEELRQAVKDLRQVVHLCAEYDVKIAFENHEYESSQDVLEVVRQVESEYVGAHIDTGNSMMVWEDPICAVKAMASCAVSTHFKDHMVIMVNGQPMIVGVPLGTGNIDCPEIFRILVEQSPLDRINIEVCYGYIAPFRLPEEKGYGAKLGHGCFRINEPPFDPGVVAPHVMQFATDGLELQSYAWQDLSKLLRSEAQLRDLLAFQDRAVVDSVEYVRRLKR